MLEVTRSLVRPLSSIRWQISLRPSPNLPRRHVKTGIGVSSHVIASRALLWPRLTQAEPSHTPARSRRLLPERRIAYTCSKRSSPVFISLVTSSMNHEQLLRRHVTHVSSPSMAVTTCDQPHPMSLWAGSTSRCAMVSFASFAKSVSLSWSIDGPAVLPATISVTVARLVAASNSKSVVVYETTWAMFTTRHYGIAFPRLFNVQLRRRSLPRGFSRPVEPLLRRLKTPPPL